MKLVGDFQTMKAQAIEMLRATNPTLSDAELDLAFMKEFLKGVNQAAQDPDWRKRAGLPS